MEPQIITPEIKYAGFWIRYIAFAIDGFIVSAAVLVLYIPGYFIQNNSGTYLAVLDILMPLGIWLYAILMINSYGATVGKMAVGIRVVSLDGGRLPLGRIILRETIGKILSNLIFAIGYLMVAFTKKKQGLHDKLADSVVIYKDPTKKPVVAIWVAVGLISVMVIIAIIGLAVSFFIARTADMFHSSGYQLLKEQDALIKQEVIGAVSYGIEYYTMHDETLAGYTASSTVVGCPLITNIAPDGKQMAVFGKECEMPDSYFCADIDFSTGEIGHGVYVTEAEALRGSYSCNH